MNTRAELPSVGNTQDPLGWGRAGRSEPLTRSCFRVGRLEQAVRRVWGPKDDLHSQYETTRCDALETNVNVAVMKWVSWRCENMGLATNALPPALSLSFCLSLSLSHTHTH